MENSMPIKELRRHSGNRRDKSEECGCGKNKKGDSLSHYYLSYVCGTN
jgi:hypothetical protein